MKAGIIGCGRIATSVHLPLLEKIEGVEVVAAADTNEERLRKNLEKFHIDEGYADYRRMLEKADVEAVYVCTPPETHFQIVMDSINHAKHVFCEKPIATTVKQGLAIKKRVEAKGKHSSKRLVLMPAHNFIFTPCFGQALQFIEKGEIGTVQKIQGCTASNLTFYGAKTNFRIHAKGGV
ncbi:MAG: Gfo/Idh/MocA family protein, partial [Candidatus Bathyarchaeia archaeon]